MKKLITLLILASVVFFNGCREWSASLPRPLTEDPQHRAAQRHHADPISRAITVDRSDTTAYLITEDYALDGYPIISYYQDDNSFTRILAVVIDHSNIHCYAGLARVDNLRVSMSGWSADSDSKKVKKDKILLKPKLADKTKPKLMTLSGGTVPNPRRPHPPFRVHDGYTVCEIVPNPSAPSPGGNIYDIVGYDY